MEEGSKTVLPSKAYAKVSCRLVPHQDHEKISKLFEEYIARVAPAYVKVRVTPKHGGQGYVCPICLLYTSLPFGGWTGKEAKLQQLTIIPAKSYSHSDTYERQRHLLSQIIK